MSHRREVQGARTARELGARVGSVRSGAIDGLIARMKADGVSYAEIGRRLKLDPKEVRKRHIRLQASAPAPADEGEGEP